MEDFIEERKDLEEVSRLGIVQYYTPQTDDDDLFTSTVLFMYPDQLF